MAQTEEARTLRRRIGLLEARLVMHRRLVQNARTALHKLEDEEQTQMNLIELLRRQLRAEEKGAPNAV